MSDGLRPFPLVVMMRILTKLVCGLLAVGAAACGEVSTGGGKLEWGPAWSVSGEVVKGKDVSGAATVGSGEAVVASDETRGAQRVVVDRAARVLTVQEPLPLLPGKGTELDLEAVAAASDRQAYFLVGSQALSRKTKTFEAERGYVFRMPVDARGRAQPGAVAKADLRRVLAADADLSQFLNLPAEENGLDIEGLAERGGRLFFGLRAPVRDDQATVLEVGVGDLFSGRAELTRHRLAFGRGRGIRDLAALQGETGFLVLVGPSGGPDSGRSDTGAQYELWHWPGPGAVPARIGALGAVPGEPEAKAEAIMVLDQTKSVIDALIFHDGPKNGAPHAVRLTLPQAR